MLTHPAIVDANGKPVRFHLQATIDYILHIREEIKRMREVRGAK